MSPPDRKGRFEIKFTAILSLCVILRARTRSVPTGKGEDGICHTHPPQSCPHHCKGLFHVEQSRLCCQDVLQGFGSVGMAARKFPGFLLPRSSDGAVAVPVGAGVRRAHPGWVAGGSRGLGGPVQVRGWVEQGCGSSLSLSIPVAVPALSIPVFPFILYESK